MNDGEHPKPAHLGPNYGEQFEDASIVLAYRHRPPYPGQIYNFLSDLLPRGPAAILDAGCGNGDLALGLRASIRETDRLDAVDRSAGMVFEGRRRPGGDDPRLNWQIAPMETAVLYPPYALVTAGESLHWMDWPVVLPRFREALLPGGVLAIVGRNQLPARWSDDHLKIIQRHSTNLDFQPYDLVEELTSRGLFTVRGSRTTAPVTHQQSIDGYVESWHSRNGLSRDRMSPDAAAFDRETRELLASLGYEDSVTFEVVGSVTWGLPAR
ncbi:MAG: class I SAM-dependent methyltransferase [Thermomicrobiales bacterium]